MEFSPQKFHEIVFQLLFSLDGNGTVEEELIPFVMRELEVSKKNVRAAFEKAHKVWEECSFLDTIISERTEQYALERIKSVEKNVLRLAFYELMIEKTLNPKIILSEAHRLARKFSTLEGASFVNALLDNSRESSNNPADARPQSSFVPVNVPSSYYP